MPPVRTSGARYATDSEMATIDFVYPAISPEQGASKIVKKISQQMAKLCRKLKWLVFFGTRRILVGAFGFLKLIIL